jgi:RNA polymerase sigma-70 factor (ECF subfamily)
LCRQNIGTQLIEAGAGARRSAPGTPGRRAVYKEAVVGPPRSEDRLVALARDGDADAYAELVRAHQDVAFRTAMLITGNASDAEEAAQDGFVKAWRSLPRFRPGAPLRPWLLTIVANEARNRARGAGRREGLVLRVAAATSSDALPGSPEAVAIEGAQRTALLDAMGRLRMDDRVVLGCRFLLELTEAETAAALGVRPGTVKSLTSRALARLREELGDA